MHTCVCAVSVKNKVSIFEIDPLTSWYNIPLPIVCVHVSVCVCVCVHVSVCVCVCAC